MGPFWSDPIIKSILVRSGKFCFNAGLSQPFLGMGPGPLELGKIALFRLNWEKYNVV